MAREKLGYLNGEVKAPSSTDAKYKKWRSENSMVTAWLINSMEPTIGKPFMFLPTAHGIWEAISKHTPTCKLFSTIRVKHSYVKNAARKSRCDNLLQ